MRQELEFRIYKIKISRSEHIQDDPLLDCRVYTIENSYNQTKMEHLLTKKIGCLPPLYTPDLNKMCNEKFNVSTNKNWEIKYLLYQFIFQNWDFECEIPCTRNKYATRFLSKASWPQTTLNLAFERTVDVTQSTFSIDEQTLLTKLGGAVSSGRTLLWILVSILGAAQVIFN